MKKIKPFIYIVLWLCAGISPNTIFAQCAPDNTPPVIASLANITLEIDPDVGVVLYPQDLFIGLSDNCTLTEDLIVNMSLTWNSTLLLDSLYYPPGSPLGDFLFTLRFEDEAGNTSIYSSAKVTLINYDPNCDPDVTPPAAICEIFYTVISDTSFILTPEALDNGSFDLCTNQQNLSYFLTADYLGTSPPSTTTITYPAGYSGIDTVALWVVDEAGLFNSCLTIINFELPPNCNPDLDAPVAICDIVTMLISDQDIVLTPADLDDGSYDSCTDQNNLSFFITSDYQGTTLPTTTSITYPAGYTGTDTVALWIVDQAGNTNTCVAEVVVNDCPPTPQFPTITCNFGIEIPYNANGNTITPEMIVEPALDSCTLANNDFYISQTSDFSDQLTSLFFDESTLGDVDISIMVVDANGNTAICWTTLTFLPDPQTCITDTIPPMVVCHENMVVQTFAIPNDFHLHAEDFIDTASDNCTSTSNLAYFISYDGTLTTPPTIDSIAVPTGTNGLITAYLWVVDEAGNFSSCSTEVLIRTNFLITGKVFLDQNMNCQFDSLEQDLGNYPFRYTLDGGATYTNTVSDINGNLLIVVQGFSGLSEMTVERLLTPGQSSSCQTSYTIDLLNTNDVVNLEFPADLVDNCDNMTVDIATIALRRCLPSTYNVQYCNNSTYAIDSVELLVTLPTSMVIQSVGAPYTDLGNGQLLFDIGQVESGDCGQFFIEVVLDCNTPLGATKCVQAEIAPHTCDDPTLSYNGSDLVVSAICDDDLEKVRFTITNEGATAMSEAREYIVIEDVIMYMQNPIQLNPGQSEMIEFPANGSTWRLEIEQDAGHPSLSNPSATIEGCIEYGSMGYVNQFSQPDADPYIAIDCQEVIGSYDPNDKMAYPEGYAEEHFIKANTSIEYKIRFQNTGTDTAFTVRLEDQISTHLEFSTIEAGASSHPYRLEVGADGLLVFHFADINLPDSTTNESASHGFVQFRINQLADLPLGTRIENTADIYFDFNEAIRTNTTFHTVGADFVIVSSTTTVDPNIAITVAPNPFFTQTVFTLDGATFEGGRFELFDLLGRQVKQDYFENNQYTLQRGSLSAGTYLFRMRDKTGILASGKLIVL